MTLKTDRRTFIVSLGAGVIAAATVSADAKVDAQLGEAPANLSAQIGEAPYNAMGERVGEVTERSAIVHARLTAGPVRNNGGYVFPNVRHEMPQKELKALKMPPGVTIADLQGDCPGQAGKVRLHYGQDSNLHKARTTEWVSVDASTDFTHQFFLEDLRPNTSHYYAVEMAGSNGKTRMGKIGQFGTAPTKDTWRPVKFTAITCQHYVCRDLKDPDEGYRTYRSMGKLSPDFMVQTGDNVYYDTEPPLVNTIELARHHWHRMQSLPTIVDFLRAVPAYWQKDDHDTFEDDDWPTREAHRVDPLNYADLVPVFREQVPVGPPTIVEPLPYRRFRWGQGIEIWLLEGRDFRAPNPAPDGPDKLFWGAEQKAWIKETILASDAQFRIIISPTAIVGPDQPGRDYFKFPGGNGDNLSNAAWATEGHEFRTWVKDNKLTNVLEICGDRHWQYFSVDPDSGLHEFSVGAVSDPHTVDPFPEDPRYHRFLRFKGGFVSVSLDGAEEKPVLSVRFHDVDGNVVHEYTQHG
jgi:alkaline phosphatase D